MIKQRLPVMLISALSITTYIYGMQQQSPLNSLLDAAQEMPLTASLHKLGIDMRQDSSQRLSPKEILPFMRQLIAQESYQMTEIQKTALLLQMVVLCQENIRLHQNMRMENEII